MKNEMEFPCECIPLNACSWPDDITNGSLVRNRCIIQQPLPFEIFIESYKARNKRTEESELCTMRYKEMNLDSPPWYEEAINTLCIDDSIIFDHRFLFYCTPIPGEQPWVGKQGKSFASLGKRFNSLHVVKHSIPMKMWPSLGSNSISRRSKWINYFCLGSDTSQLIYEERNDCIAGLDGEKIQEKERKPIPSSSMDCIIKIYDGACQDATEPESSLFLRINDVVEFYGIYYSLSNSTVGGRELEAFCKIPRIHILDYKKLKSWNPFYAAPDDLTEFYEEALANIFLKGPRKTPETIIEGLLKKFRGNLGGDALAAYYVLMCIGCRNIRKDMPSLGKISLNLCIRSDSIGELSSPAPAKHSTEEIFGQESHQSYPTCTTAITPTPLSLDGRRTKDSHDTGILCIKLQNVATRLKETCQSLCPRVSYLSLENENLNTTEFVPSMKLLNDTMDVLESGPLQLAEGTILLIDEVPLRSGPLTECGRRNIAALQCLISMGMVPYRIQQDRVQNFETELNLIFLSEGKSIMSDSMDIILPLNSSIKCNKMALEFPAMRLSGEELLQYRHFLSFVKCFPHPLKISSTVMEHIVQFFADIRQEEQSLKKCLLSVGNEFNNWITLARSFCLLHGSFELTLELWETLMQLEKERKSRLLAYEEDKQRILKVSDAFSSEKINAFIISIGAMKAFSDHKKREIAYFGD
ncbi:hypothetical protein IE077_003027 [Cardiosporidium cionae]|uniref:Mini-chromosome maintenance complex-binding protein n=1 Tax=Cardiosporidium cionae TaxID=476202 RepID=A0ABQ7J975_9APIC|nr:hypothetical protein IE077_003027 [Cardiosporidium cionae]|eukprot:KAF8820566.1 hypothetical protein IE077_003027 [Cardiosporidium cionae]